MTEQSLGDELPRRFRVEPLPDPDASAPGDPPDCQTPPPGCVFVKRVTVDGTEYCVFRCGGALQFHEC